FNALYPPEIYTLPLPDALPISEEKGVRAAEGALPVRLYRPAGAGPFPFVVLLHGCGGLHYEAMWRSWVEPWAELFREHGIGTAVDRKSTRLNSSHQNNSYAVFC